MKMYLHKSQQFYADDLLSNPIKTNFHATYSLSFEEIRNINHKDRPCYDKENFDDYLLEVKRANIAIQFSVV